jgi:hypothetical protein
LRVVYSFFSLVLLSFLPHVSLPFQAFLSSLFGSLLFNALFFVLVVEMSSLQPVGPSLCLHWNCSPCCVPLSWRSLPTTQRASQIRIKSCGAPARSG